MTVVPHGIYVPTLTFFLDGGALDVDACKQHAVRLAKAGVTGLVVNGTTGEPAHLSRAERRATLTASREALDGAGFPNMPIIAGCGVPSTWETIELCVEAAELGAAFVLVLPPSYYKAAMSEELIYKFFVDVAEASPIPLLLYNFPGVANGIDLSLSLIARLAKHPKIVGIKLSCGNIGKAARLSSLYPSSEFAVFSGLAETMLHLLSGTQGSGAGVVTGLANVSPKACVRVYDLFKAGKMEEARAAQTELSLAAELEIAGGVPAMRYGVVKYFGYGGVSRAPLPDASDALKAQTISWLEPLMEREV